MKRPIVLQGVGFYKPSSIHLLSAQKKIIASQIFCASSLWSLSTGLMCRKLEHKQAMIFLFPKRQKQVSLHMFCVFHPIDVLFCKTISTRASLVSFEILDIKKNFRPFTHYTSLVSDCDMFIELPRKASASLSLGDVLSLR